MLHHHTSPLDLLWLDILHQPSRVQWIYAPPSLPSHQYPMYHWQCNCQVVEVFIFTCWWIDILLLLKPSDIPTTDVIKWLYSLKLKHVLPYLRTLSGQIPYIHHLVDRGQIYASPSHRSLIYHHHYKCCMSSSKYATIILVCHEISTNRQSCHPIGGSENMYMWDGSVKLSTCPHHSSKSSAILFYSSCFPADDMPLFTC
jgi:hypothetical protein